MNKFPKVHLVMVSSLDGVIAKNSNEFIDWSSKEDKKYFSTITKEKGCLVMGSSTFKTIGRPLPDRLNVILTSRPDEMSNKYGEHENLMFISINSAKELLELLSKKGFQEIVLGGGTKVNTMFAKENMIDYLHLSVEPVLVGSGMQIFDEEVRIDLSLVENIRLNENTVLLKYSVIH